MTTETKDMTSTHITAQYLKANPNSVFVFGDNLLRKGKKGAATLRDEPNAYGFVTKKAPSYADSAYYRPSEYSDLFTTEMDKLTRLIESSPEKTFLVTPLGSGLANRYLIYEKIIRPALRTLATQYPNVVLLGEAPQ